MTNFIARLCFDVCCLAWIVSSVALFAVVSIGLQLGTMELAKGIFLSSYATAAFVATTMLCYKRSEIFQHK